MSAVRPPTDAEVVARSIDAPDAFVLIYDRYIGELHGYLAARLGTQAADELAPRLFRRAFIRRRRYDPGRGTVRQWLEDLVRRKEPPVHGTVPPPSREVVALGRNRLRELAAAPRPASRVGPAVLALTGAAAIAGVIVFTTQQAEPTTAPRDLCLADDRTEACAGPLPAVLSRPWVGCGGVKACTTPPPRPARPPRSLPGRTPS